MGKKVLEMHGLRTCCLHLVYVGRSKVGYNGVLGNWRRNVRVGAIESQNLSCSNARDPNLINRMAGVQWKSLSAINGGARRVMAEQVRSYLPALTVQGSRTERLRDRMFVITPSCLSYTASVSHCRRLALTAYPLKHQA